MTTEEMRELLKRYRLGLCSEEEKQKIEAWYAAFENRDDWQWTEDEKQLFKDKLEKRIAAEIAGDALPIIAAKRNVIGWRIAAAVVFICVLTGLSFIYFNNRTNKPANAPISKVNNKLPHDALPGTSGAVLTLSNGTQISLDSSK